MSATETAPPVDPGVTAPPSTERPAAPVSGEAKQGAAKGKPRTTAPKSDSDPKPGRGPGRPSRDDRMRDQLVDFYATIAMVSMVASPADAIVIAQHSETMADSWMALAKANPKVRRVLERFLETSAWGAVIAAHAPVALAIAANHGALPPSMVSMFETPDDAAAAAA